MRQGGGALRKEQLSSGRKVSPEQIAEFRAMFADGYSTYLIAEKTGWSQFTIWKYTKKKL